MRKTLAAALAAFVAISPVLAQEPVQPVKTMVVEARDQTIRRTFFGTVVARQTVDLAFQVSGQIHEFPVLEGQPVTRGDLIAQLDLEPFEIALDRARVQQRQVDQDLDRLRRLSSSTVSQAQLDAAATASDLAALAVRDAEFALEHASLHAPFDGLVASRNVANFTTIQAGTPVVRLHDVSEWRVEIDVPEVLFRRAGEDPNIEIFGVFSGSDRHIPLEFRELRAEASSVGQTFQITLAMTEEPGGSVLPGNSITVVVGLQSPGAGIEIPPSAVVIGDDGTTSVMVFDPGEGDAGSVRQTQVTVGTGPDGEFILEGGLETGAEVVVAGANMLTDGQAVRRFTGFSN